MASDQKFVAYILDQLSTSGSVEAKKMFGEYGLYLDTKLFALVCDNKLFIKPTPSGQAYLQTALVEAPPFPGAKPCFLIEEGLDDRLWLSELVRLTVRELPPPKPKKPKPK
ncbi:TfoX/Sxy family protein [Hymenobacter glaciei]|uniref:TfoX/Sxy family protein n=1 Tax=Hymenobacter glaciei TaxID=877209 RepID=A0ABP7UE74_9BACT